jgi:PelA/Pel-15E family pectate lyase
MQWKVGGLMSLVLCASVHAAGPSREEVLATMKKATAFMTGKVAYKGGYCSTYLPDLSRRWGEMESTPTQIWIQNPGTPQMGQLFLDAYHATGDEAYYEAASATARALIAAQHPRGGWNYLADLAGEDALKTWYETVGKNAWRLEEYQHYYGNATFDDDTTHDAARFMLRIAREKNDPAFTDSFQKSLGFILESQYPNGGWPQRFPLQGGFSKDGLPDYTGCITYNDAVCSDNVDFLLEVYGLTGDAKLLEPIRRGMECFLLTRGQPPQPAWGLQHDPKTLLPAAARTYEPKAYVTNTTASNIALLLRFHRLTGDRRYLEPIPAALDWLDAVKLPPELSARGTHPTFIEVGTNLPLYIHRKGSNAINGHYFADRNPEDTIGHYSSFRRIDVAGLRARYQEALALPAADLLRDSPLRPDAPRTSLPRFVTASPRPQRATPATNPAATDPPRRDDEAAARAVASLAPEGFWPTPLRSTSNPFHGDGPQEVASGNFGRTAVGDAYDTSPYTSPTPVQGISIATYVQNMGAMIRYLESMK